jgi:hypothetical protein
MAGRRALGNRSDCDRAGVLSATDVEEVIREAQLHECRSWCHQREAIVTLPPERFVVQTFSDRFSYILARLP